MDNISELRKRVLSRVKQADNRLLQMIESLAEVYESGEESSVPEVHYELLDMDRKLHEKDKTYSVSWQQVKEKLIQKHEL